MGDRLDAATLRTASREVGLPVSIDFVPQTGSTNADLRLAASRGAPHGYALVAGSQTAGRGRKSRDWSSPPDSGLWLSIVLQPAMALDRVPLIALAGGIAVAKACGPEYRLKWPNDVWGPADQKVAGLLAEAETDGTSVAWVVLGIGLNVFATPPGLPEAGSLVEIDGRHRARAPLAAALVRGVLAEVRHLEQDPALVIDRWKERAATLGRQVVAGDLRGVATDLDPDGALRIVDASGIEHRIVAGDVVPLPSN